MNNPIWQFVLFPLFLGGNLGFAMGFAARGEWTKAMLHALVVVVMAYSETMTRHIDMAIGAGFVVGLALLSTLLHAWVSRGMT